MSELQFDPSDFPRLNDDNHRVTSPQAEQYDCVMHALGDTRSYFSGSSLVRIGGYLWPSNVPPVDTVEGWSRFFSEEHGYEQCEDGNFEDGFIKIAIYADTAGAPSHAARQLETGKWTSKLGSDYDIEHDTLAALEGSLYGTAVRFLRKPSGDG